MVQEIWLELTVTWKVPNTFTCWRRIWYKGESFQHDRALCHRSHAIQKSLADERVTVLKKWPAQRPDLNSIKQM